MSFWDNVRFWLAKAVAEIGVWLFFVALIFAILGIAHLWDRYERWKRRNSP